MSQQVLSVVKWASPLREPLYAPRWVEQGVELPGTQGPEQLDKVTVNTMHQRLQKS